MKQESTTSTYQVASTLFCLIVVLSNIISAKMVKFSFLPGLLIPAGLLIYPLTFIISNFVTELYGTAKARSMVYLSLCITLIAFVIINFAVMLPTSSEGEQYAFQAVMGLSGLRICCSVIAYLGSQLVDIQLYAWIRKLTGNRWLWVRSNLATYSSQVIDTIIIDLLYMYWGLGMELNQVIPVMLFSFSYKLVFTLANTPLFYMSLFWVEKKRVLQDS